MLAAMLGQIGRPGGGIGYGYGAIAQVGNLRNLKAWLYPGKNTVTEFIPVKNSGYAYVRRTSMSSMVPSELTQI